MKLIIHDLSKEQANRILPKDKDICVISDNGKIHHCIGCFGCWIKTPAECAIKDGYSDTGELLSKCDELIIISQCFYGADITEKERRTAEDLVHANSINFDCNFKEVLFASNAEELGGKL